MNIQGWFPLGLTIDTCVQCITLTNSFDFHSTALGESLCCRGGNRGSVWLTIVPDPTVCKHRSRNQIQTFCSARWALTREPGGSWWEVVGLGTPPAAPGCLVGVLCVKEDLFWLRRMGWRGAEWWWERSLLGMCWGAPTPRRGPGVPAAGSPQALADLQEERAAGVPGRVASQTQPHPSAQVPFTYNMPWHGSGSTD